MESLESFKQIEIEFSENYLHLFKNFSLLLKFFFFFSIDKLNNFYNLVMI